MDESIRLPFEEIESQLFRITVRLGFGEEEARLIARTHTWSSCDGVASHGLNRFPRFVEYVQSGHIRIDGKMERVAELGAVERWNGQQRAGILNATESIHRAIELAKSNGIGAVALNNTNHWMRGGTYGWLAADQGCIAICMTNTTPNMAPWGGIKNAIGNNPLVLAVPRADGHVVLDMATSQYSYGKMEDTARKGERLPYPGGWDHQGQLTDDPEAILRSGRVLPAGLWKGSGLTILVDMMVTLLAGGQSTHQIGRREHETNLSQLFICIDTRQSEYAYQIDTEAIIESIHDTAPEGGNVYFPGERTLKHRTENLKNGIPVDQSVWNEILNLAD